MKSSEGGKNSEGFFLRGPVYSILAVYIPLCFLVTLFVICAAALPAAGLPVSPPYGLLFFLSLFSAAAASCYYYVMKDVKSNHTAADIRGTVTLLVLIYAAASLASFGIPLGRRFLPSLSNSAAVLFSLYTVVSVTALKELFSAREEFEGYIKAYSGEKLREILSEDAMALQYQDGSMGKSKIAYALQLSIIVIIIAVSAILNIPLPPAAYVLPVVLVINGIVIFTFINRFKAERYYAGEGLTLSEGDRIGHGAGIGIFTAAAVGAAFLSVSEKNTLPFSLITGFFHWLLSLFPRRPPPEAEPIMQDMPDLMAPPPMLPAFLTAEEIPEPWPVWEWLQYALIGFLAAVFILFMLKPLFLGGALPAAGRSLVQKLRRMADRWLKTLGDFIQHCIEYFRGTRPSPGPAGSLRLRRLSADLLKAYSPAKRREMRNSATLFARLVIWGIEHCRVPWKPSCAPGEYCALLAASPAVTIRETGTPEPEAGIPEEEGSRPSGFNSHDAVIRCGELFEEALYSSVTLSEEGRREFRRLVQTITSIRTTL
ncbi:MAG: hypothetical protein LBD78_01380 [Spirochaetaceae bacterium]|jgi:hypothetical protein|nr:hypothetical protein [Spirochaetaceae bacterium]